MRDMFADATSFNADISQWDVSKVKFWDSDSVRGMFMGASSFQIEWAPSKETITTVRQTSSQSGPDSTTVPVPITRGNACKSWCNTNSEPWLKKCRWPDGCAGCPQCLVITDNPLTASLASTGLCKNWCLSNSQPWTRKCTWSDRCDGCPECSDAATNTMPAEPACKKWCNTHAQPWTAKCGWLESCGSCPQCSEQKQAAQTKHFVMANSAEVSSILGHIVTMSMIFWLSCSF